MDFTICGSQLSTRKNKSGSITDIESERSGMRQDCSEKSNRSSMLPSKKTFKSPDFSLHSTPVSSSRRSDKEKNDISSRNKGPSRVMMNNMSHSVVSNSASSNRRSNMEMFLDLRNISKDFNDDDGVKKWLDQQKIADWEEISISSGSSKPRHDAESNRVLPINKNAFESQNFSLVKEDDNESAWTESVKTLVSSDSDSEIIRLNSARIEKKADDRHSNQKRFLAAKTIQTWFRRHLKRRKMAEAAMRRMLSEKQMEMRKQESPLELFENVKKHVSSVRSSASITNKSIKSLGQCNEIKANQKNSHDKEVAEKEVEKLKLENKITNARPTTSARPTSARSKASSKQSPMTPKTSQQSSNVKIKNTKTKEIVASNSDCKGKEKPLTDRTEVSDKESQQSDRTANSINQQPTVTTIDDILSTIKELESVDCLTDRSSNLHRKGKGAWSTITSDIELLLQPDEFRQVLKIDSNGLPFPKLTSTSLEVHNKLTKDGTTTDTNDMALNQRGSQISDSKMNNILKFLNTSEMLETLSEVDNKSIKSIPVKPWKYTEQVELEENSKIALNDVTTKIMTMRLELEEKQRSIEMLQKALQQQRELTIRQVKETQKDMEKRISCQKDEYESALQRNHTFIDQLISKNELLQDKCNKLVVEVKDKTTKYEEKMKNIQDNHTVEIKKVEAKHTAAEKLRREKWETEKTKLIKEMTIKGMESEIAQLIANHKQELRKLKQYYENELVKSEENGYEKYNKQIEELRKQLYREKEEAIQKEHDIAKERFDQEIQRQVHILETQRKQLYQEITDERDRLNMLATKQKTEVENLRKQLEYKEDKVGETLKLEHKQELEDVQRKYENEIRELKTQTDLERQIWLETQKKKNEAAFLSREQEIKNEMKKGRDQEIERVIVQLEKDSSQMKEEMEAMYNNKLRRAKDKYEAEINELETSERQTKEKYNQIRAEFLEVEGEHESLKVILRQKEKEIDEVKQLYETLHKEREHVSDIIRQEFADRLVATEEENRKMKREISELKAKITHIQNSHSEEIERLQTSHQSDMSEVHNKVKDAIKRKEENMSDLRNQFQMEVQQWQEKLTASEKRCEHLESLLDQQRKQLLKLK